MALENLARSSGRLSAIQEVFARARRQPAQRKTMATAASEYVYHTGSKPDRVVTCLGYQVMQFHDGKIIAYLGPIPMGVLSGEINFEKGDRSLSFHPIANPTDNATLVRETKMLAPAEVSVQLHYPPSDLPYMDFRGFGGTNPRGDELYHRINAAILDTVREVGIHESSVVCEVGCANASLGASIIRATQARVYSTDIEESNIRNAREVKRQVLSSQLQKRHYVFLMDVRALASLPPADLSIASGLFNMQVINSEDHVLQGVRRLIEATKLNGIIILTGHTALWINEPEMEKMGCKVITRSLPDQLYGEMTCIGQFYVLQKIDNNPSWPTSLRLFREQSLVSQANQLDNFSQIGGHLVGAEKSKS
ncbi:hypothetical protein A2291_07905 [candidate division WOR-1 bacterium RIFOXYB2_FULL_42_35]|uniref:Methyltransferase domain-containing protein n=1 Tax=candidate division WOR-1 bacterium RIFOXYC2_FULL_41_25 TaxID=1802586 RepID=A0A1F4TJ58_UNCSA|nr:MAG: hypothetical protein A2247_08430 [candidate division WOR-1 bacterium RIFOXYA2_FULL_41_14]OGC21891.1 MAG: hypothetical protein A2291_07905 [candidate division WOR-1 bacterium RIFOXYB2_FULL_42_35]OGC32755.1 MAG: hypothetical protein A2462_03880 [candidate division WOR-1 bacterium RIFOXYC2_FULL_41_25]OGC42551.1 MAG: hypothetical protein A2548_01135 [candidate division WOR-1 bacterium RIFOXYD2_FULL_41_8]